MADYTIFTDAAADLPLEWYDRYKIQGVSMEYTLSDVTKTLLPGEVEIDKICDSFYDDLRAGAKTSTTQATPYKYIEAFSPVLEAGNDILYAHPNVIASNVFCAWNHPIGMDFGDIFKSEDSMLQARELIVRYFEQINCKNPSGHASVQYQDWKLFKAFCDAQGIHE